MGSTRLIAWITSILGLITQAFPLFPLQVQIVEEQILVRVNEPSPFPQLEILSTPSDAWVYIEGNFSGPTPLILKDLPPSFYRIQVQKSGYRPLTLSVTLKTGIRTRIQLELEAAYGTLSLGNVPPECRVYVAGNLVSGKNVSLPVGRYRVAVQRFGYEDIVTQVTILEGKTTEISLPWKRVPLSVSHLTVKPQRINPENRYASARISFRISTPAETTIVIQDLSGKTVWEKSIVQPETSKQEVDWDGRDQRGIPLPDGTYRLILQYKTGETSTELTREIYLDRMVRTPFYTTYSGLSGLLFSPGVSRLDPGSFMISSWILGHSGSSHPKTSPSLAHAGISFPIGDGWELTPTLSSFMEANDIPPDWIGGIGVQYRWKDTGTVSLGISGKGTYMNQPRAYGFSQLGGLSLGVILDGRYGFFGFLLSPEFTLSPYNLQTLEHQMNLYGSLRLGWFLDLKILRAGISSVLSANVSNLRLLPIYHTGIEFYWKPPTLPFVFCLSTVFIQSFNGNILLYWGGGLGSQY